MSHKLKGHIIAIGKSEKKSETFTLRNFAIQTDGQYPQEIKYQLFNDRCDLLDQFNEDDEVTVHFDIRGNRWEGKIFNNLVAWKIEPSIRQASPPPVQPPSNVPAPSDDDDSLPF